ncbi:MAG TPA: GAF domain-containing protein, partial [Solirubrobacteraceae bacterium]|nr:GAF domain-containing protein [Solirubrobacteraceae bacterium]
MADSPDSRRDCLVELADEQAALRRVATLVARGAPADKLFATVTEEAARLLPVDFASLGRYESDNTMTAVAVWTSEDHGPLVGRRWELGGENASTLVRRTGAPIRMDCYDDPSGELGDTRNALGIRTAVAAPIAVEGQLWGVLMAASTLEQPLPPET